MPFPAARASGPRADVLGGAVETVPHLLEKPRMQASLQRVPRHLLAGAAEADDQMSHERAGEHATGQKRASEQAPGRQGESGERDVMIPVGIFRDHGDHEAGRGEPAESEPRRRVLDEDEAHGKRTRQGRARQHRRGDRTATQMEEGQEDLRNVPRCDSGGDEVIGLPW